MSVSFKASEKTASSVRRERLETLTSLFQKTDELKYSQAIGGEIVQHTRDANMDGVLRASNNNGLVNALTLAYNQHHNIVLRPEDFWTAVLTQFSSYVNANSEALRDKFVNFDGKRELKISAGGSLSTAPYDTMSVSMTDQIAANLKDDSIRDWIMPSFTTTTTNDRVVCSIVMMASMQNYFSYKYELCCGIPQVTLLGTPEDYMSLARRVDRLVEFDNGTGVIHRWHALMKPIFDELVRASQGNSNMDFWNRVCSHFGGGSGPSFLSGWVTAFCYFNDKGVCQATQFSTNNWDGSVFKSDYPLINTNDIPSGLVSVPVTVDDNGREYKTRMLAGSFAMNTLDDTTIAPRLDWCIGVIDETKFKEDPYAGWC